MKWPYLGKDTIIWPGVPCKRLTLLTASIFVTEGFFIYIYFLLFEKKNNQNRISRAGENISPTILLIFRKMIALAVPAVYPEQKIPTNM